jgi:ABC-type Fe3+/spermidine/putrescine transport system ATPase subunit
MMVSDRIALVRNGKIVQVGTPKQIYFQPANLFAAYFFSDTVYFPGVVASVEDSTYDVIVAKNIAFKVENPVQRYKAGDAVVLVVRNDYFKIYAEPVSSEEKDNILDGKIIGVKFMGPFIRFTVNLSIGNTIAIDIPSTYGIAEKFPEGQKVWLTFNPKKAFLFPDPGEEKLKELYFEI